MERIRTRTRSRAMGVVLSSVISLSALMLGACGGGGGAGGSVGDEILERKDIGSPSEVAQNSEFLNVAVRYVSYVDSGGSALAGESAVKTMFGTINRVWAQCNIGVVLERYEAIQPSSIGAPYNPGTYSAIDSIRQTLQSPSSLLMIASGQWGRANDLGSANCYSSFPGDDADGIICEGSVATNAYLMAHEVGHWFDLRHTNDPDTDYVADTTWDNHGSNVMESVVGSSQNTLTPGQCARARQSIAEFRRQAIAK